MDDRKIAASLKAGNSESLEILFKKYYQYLTNIAFYIIKDKATAEDLVQELFVKLWNRKGQLPDIENLKGYLSTSIKNRALDLIKSQQVQAGHLEEYMNITSLSGEQLDQDTHLLKAHIDHGLGQLPPKCRLIFSLNRFEGLTNDEIAEYLQISKRTVETQISKALKILRLELQEVMDKYLSILFY